MDLFSATFSGYRRYADTWINLDAPVIAIVGPNEAGKTSLLRALALAGHDDPVPDADITRGLTVPADGVLVRLRFRVSRDELPSHPYPESAGRWLILTKRRDGPRTFTLEPPLLRDRASRIRLVAALEALTQRRWYQDAVSDTEGEAVATDALALIRTEDENLSEETLTALAELRRFLAEDIGEDTARRDVQRVQSALEAALRTESEQHPNEVALDALRPQVPTFLEFDEPSRNLRSTYNLQDPGDFSAPALRNLAGTAGLNLRALRDAIAGGNAALAKSFVEQANERLQTVLTEAWHQSELEVEFDHEGPVLQIFARTNRRDFFFLQDRSDGLRSFIALHAFAHRGSGAKPVLLVDEAEVHLHYDAQADMVGVFEAQELADRIIYTTHSAGCLPRDLGRSVRVVEADPTADRSVVKNQFWELGPGATPLIMSMGATTLAFTAARYAVFAEGPSDHLLLPSLMREVKGLESLPFHVLPGLASAGPARFAELQLGASRSAFLVDGDEGGDALRRSLIADGIPEKHIVMLGRRRSSGLQLEDLVDPILLCAGTNEELQRWRPQAAEIPPSALPRRMRMRAIQQWCDAQGVPAPGRPAIAVRILALVQRDDTFRSIADAGHRRQVEELFDHCVLALGITV